MKDNGRLNDLLMLGLAIALELVVLLRGSTAEKVVGTEIALVLILVSVLNHNSPEEYSGRRQPLLSHRSLTVLEYMFLASAFTNVFLINGYERPLTFFFSIIGFYSLMLVKAISPAELRMGPFIVELVLGQFIFIESFALLYPGFVAVDSYRDLWISQSIIANAGGLPRNFGAVVWYDFSPIAPLLYSSASLVSRIPLRLTELLLGFTFPMIITFSLYAIAYRVTSSAYVARIAMMLCSLLPYLWLWASWPIPETLALAFVILGTELTIRGSTSKGFLGTVFFVISTVLTHGGMAVILTVLMLVVYASTRSRLALNVCLMTTLTLLSYSILVVVLGAQAGLTSILNEIWAIFTPAGFQFQAPSVGQLNLIGISESLVGTYWWILLATLAWLGFSTLYDGNQMTANRRLVTSLTILGGFFFVFGILSAVVVTQSNAGRYVGLGGYVLMTMPAALGVVSLEKRIGSRKRVALSLLLLLFVVSGISSPLVSPDLWQDAGQSHYAAVNRLIYSTTYVDRASQTFLRVFDSRYYVVSNYYLEFTNMSFSNSMYVLSTSTLHIGTEEPYLILISFRAIQMHFPPVTQSTNLTLGNYDVIYSSEGSGVTLVYD